jgi:ATP-dependent DNA helicase DinG
MSDDNFPHLDPNKIDEAFVMDKYREGQREVLEYAVNGLNQGKKFIILECPTGSGKSAIGMTLCGMVRDSYYLTITKILQDQLARDFSDIVLLKGRNSYPCTFYDIHGQMLVDRKFYTIAQLNKKKDENPSCNEGFCKSVKAKDDRAKSGKSQCTKCFPAETPSSKHPVPRGDQQSLDGNKYSSCPYFEQVYQAINSKKVSMNFTSFIYQTALTNRFQNPRDLIIIDEAHNIEQQVLDYVSITINDDMLKEHGYFIPPLKTAKDYLNWFKEININEILVNLRDIADIANDQDQVDEIDKLTLKLEVFATHVNKEGSEWVVDYRNDNVGRDQKPIRSVTLKPVFATGLVDDIIFKFGKRIVLLSATILDVDVMCRSLGIDRKDVAAYRMRNRFPKANRPIYIKPAARMVGGKDKMQEWMPKLVKAVEDIIIKYPNKRGIIHTHNFAIMDAIVSTNNKAVSRRLINQKEFPNKSDLLEFHSRQEDSVIVAPAMHEGVDLRDDLSRFQVICKVPYANFYENPQLARRVEVDSKYYDWMTALKLIQSYGRSIRSAEDYADTYIIDEAVFSFLNKAKSMIPQWFTEAIVK